MEIPRSLGPYQLEVPIGSGGTGAVYRARHTDTGRVVALKVIRMEGRVERASAEREIDVLTALQHPGIVEFLGRGEQGMYTWIAMELLEGPTLRSCLASGKVINTWSPFEDPEPGGHLASRIDTIALDPLHALGQVAHTLAWLHGMGVVHRDVKPENILIYQDRAILVDFGLSALTGAKEHPEPLAGGTVGYMAPEQAQCLRVDSRADLYALGCILHEILQGTTPLHGPELCGDKATDALLGRLLAHAPEDRVPSATEVANLLGVERVGPAPRAVSFRAPLVGRTQALAIIGACVEARRGAVLLGGEVGAGKSRLALEVFAQCRRRRWQLAGGPLGSRTVAVLKSIVETAVDQWVRRPGTEAEAALLAAAAGRLGVPTGPLDAPVCSGGGRRDQVLGGLTTAVSRVAAVRPTLLLLDDLHEADPLLQEAVAWIARSAPPGVVVLATWNTDIVALPQFLSRDLVVHLLGPLTAEDTQRLGQGVRGGPVRVPIDIVAGNPLRCVEWVRWGVSGQDLEQAALRRFRTLPSAAQQLVQLMSLAQGALPIEKLSVAFEGGQVATAVHWARLEGFLDTVSPVRVDRGIVAGTEQGSIRFAHRALQATIASELKEGLRRHLHSCLARATVGVLHAHHVQQAGDLKAAREAWLQVAQMNADDLEVCRHALGRVEQLTDGPLAPRLLLRIAELSEDDIAASLARVQRALDQQPGIELQIDAHNLRAKLLVELGRAEESLLAVDRAVSLAASHDRVALVHSLLNRATCSMRTGHRVACFHPDLQHALSMAEGLPEVQARAYSLLGSQRLSENNPHEAIEALEAGVAIKAGSVDHRCSMLGNLGAARWQVRDVAGAMDAQFANTRLALRAGHTKSLYACLVNLGLCYAMGGEATTAEQLIGGGLHQALRLGRARLIVGSVLVAANVWLENGAWMDCVRWAGRGVGWSEHNRDPRRAAEARFLQATALLALGELDEAERLLVCIPVPTRNDVNDLRTAIETARGGGGLPTKASAARSLAVAVPSPEHRAHAANLYREEFQETCLNNSRIWALYFGCPPLPPAIELGPLPPELHSLCVPLQAQLMRAEAAMRRTVDAATQP